MYWWSKEVPTTYAAAPKLGHIAPVKQGTSTAMNARYLRRPWEVERSRTMRVLTHQRLQPDWNVAWVPYVMGAAGRCWIERLADRRSLGCIGDSNSTNLRPPPPYGTHPSTCKPAWRSPPSAPSSPREPTGFAAFRVTRARQCFQPTSRKSCVG